MDNSIAQMKGQMKRKIIPSGTTCVQCNFEYAMMPSTSQVTEEEERNRQFGLIVQEGMSA